MTTMDQEPLTSVDNAWLRMDRPTNLMMICGMMMFAERLALEEVKETIRSRMLCFHRFLQRVVRDGGGAHWENDPHFSLDWHVRHIALPYSREGGSLEAVISDLISTPLDPTKPMWQWHLIDTADGGSTLVLRIHHCYGDGFALAHVVASMTDIDPGKPHMPAPDLNAYDTRHAAWERIFGPVAEVAGDVMRSARAVIDLGYDWMTAPSHALEYGKRGIDFATAAAIIASMAPDSYTRFKGTMGVMKRAAWAEPLSLFEVKAVAEAFGCSINDVLLSCVAGALRAYLLEQDDPVEGLEVRALVPVNLRPPGPVTELGNRFSLVFLTLPIGIADPFERILEVHKRMDELKTSQQPLVAYGILMGMGMIPEAIKERVLETLAANASAVMTNVRGSPVPQYFAGKHVERQIFWVPQSGGIGMGVSILSYAGRIDFGVVTDVLRVPDPDVIVKRFVSEFQNLLFNALLMPWPMGATAGIRARARAFTPNV